jgi:hypothetical protein
VVCCWSSEISEMFFGRVDVVGSLSSWSGHAVVCVSGNKPMHFYCNLLLYPIDYSSDASRNYIGLRPCSANCFCSWCWFIMKEKHCWFIVVCLVCHPTRLPSLLLPRLPSPLPSPSTWLHPGNQALGFGLCHIFTLQQSYSSRDIINCATVFY